MIIIQIGTEIIIKNSRQKNETCREHLIDVIQSALFVHYFHDCNFVLYTSIESVTIIK